MVDVKKIMENARKALEQGEKAKVGMELGKELRDDWAEDVKDMFAMGDAKAEVEHHDGPKDEHKPKDKGEVGQTPVGKAKGKGEANAEGEQDGEGQGEGEDGKGKEGDGDGKDPKDGEGKKPTRKGKPKLQQKPKCEHCGQRMDKKKEEGGMPQPQKRHSQYDILLSCVKADAPVMLVGPAGSGKTHSCQLVATELGLEFFAQSMCSQTTMSTLLGYMDAHGKYIRTVYREAYENGGLYLFDEIDASNPNVLAVINSSIANGFCAFPDGMVRKHPKFRAVAAGNTWGLGRTTEYVGRQPIDAATLDRFVQMEWKYDEELECGFTDNEGWVYVVQQFRKAIMDRGVKHIVSPRATILGSRLLDTGMELDDVIKMALVKSLDKATADAILSPILKKIKVEKVDEEVAAAE